MEKSGGGRFCWAFLVLLGFVVVGVAQAQSGASASVKQLNALIDLNEENWRLMLSGEWMVEFFAPWCPACKSLTPTWERFANTASELNVNVAKIDVTTSPSLSGRFFVTALPTIYHVKEGEFRQYRGSRDGDALMFFIKQKQWSKLEAISAWKKPDTIHMSVLSYFFKLSHTLKDFNGRLQEEYGLPTWGSYALFAIGTIFVGAAMGLLLVCVVDFLYPPKKSQRQSFIETKAQNGIEDIANDEIEDDGPQNNDDEDEEEAEEDEDEDEEQQEDADDDEDEEENEASTGDDEEKQTQSESEEPESEMKTPANKKTQQKQHEQEQQQQQQKKEQIEEKQPPSNNPEVRKRKPRKD